MTQFEYMAIAPSLILSFSLARVFSNLGTVYMRKTFDAALLGLLVLLEITAWASTEQALKLKVRSSAQVLSTGKCVAENYQRGAL